MTINPCPHCGATTETRVQHGEIAAVGLHVWIGETGKFFVVQCEKCGASAGVRKTKRAAIACWNRRGGQCRDAAIRELVGELLHLVNITCDRETIERVAAKARELGLVE